MVFSYSKPILTRLFVTVCKMFTATHSYIRLVVATLFNTLEYGCVSHIETFSHSCYPCMFFWFSYILVWKGGSELYVAVKMWALCRFIQWHKDTPLLIILSFLFVFFGVFFACCSVFYQVFYRTLFVNLLILQWPALGQLLVCEFSIVLALWVAFVCIVFFAFIFVSH